MVYCQSQHPSYIPSMGFPRHRPIYHQVEPVKPCCSVTGLAMTLHSWVMPSKSLREEPSHQSLFWEGFSPNGSGKNPCPSDSAFLATSSVALLPSLPVLGLLSSSFFYTRAHCHVTVCRNYSLPHGFCSLSHYFLIRGFEFSLAFPQGFYP